MLDRTEIESTYIHHGTDCICNEVYFKDVEIYDKQCSIQFGYFHTLTFCWTILKSGMWYKYFSKDTWIRVEI